MNISKYDLRAGNFIGNDIHHFVVQEIKDGKVNLLRLENGGANIYKGCHKPYNELWPIPITKALLKILNFVVQGKDVFFPSADYWDLKEVKNGDDIRWEVRINKKLIKHDLKYIHELQNLFFAIKGWDTPMK